MKRTQIDPGSVLVAVDGSSHADRAVDWATRYAEVEARPLAIVHVDGVERADDVVGSDEATGGSSGHRSAVVENAMRRVGSTSPSTPVVGLAERGDPRQVLLDLTEHAHLLVMGSRGRGTLRSMLLGSVSSHVATYAACPVVVTRPVTSAEHDGVVVGADGTAASAPVLELAFRYADRHRLRLTVMHVYWDARAVVTRPGRPLPTWRDDGLALLVERSVAAVRARYPDVPVAIELVHGLVDECLSRRQRAWDLIVVGRHPVDSIARRLTGPMATAVLQRAHSAVAVVPEAVTAHEARASLAGGP